MCLGGSAAPTYQTPEKRVVAAGPPSPNDKVNNQEAANITSRARQKAMRQANRGPTASKQQGQTSSKTNKAY